MFKCVAISIFIWREEQDLLKVLCMQGKKNLINSPIKKRRKKNYKMNINITKACLMMSILPL